MLNTIAICLIIGISDGDTMKALCNNEQITIRLAEIDAPEKRQAYNQESKQSLSDLCFNEKATVTAQKQDRYRRLIAHVNCGGKDASSEQVNRGMAWVFDRYVSDHSLNSVQDTARSDRRGLWNDSAPVPPWEWRKERHKNWKLTFLERPAIG